MTGHRDRLPAFVRQMIDHFEYDPMGEFMDNCMFVLEYVYSACQDGKVWYDVALATVWGDGDPCPWVGQEVCLYGTWVRIVSVETVTETDADNRPVTFYTADVDELARGGW